MATNHKPGRKKRPCKANYNSAQRWVLNKVKRITRHLKKHPSDEQSLVALGKSQRA